MNDSVRESVTKTLVSGAKAVRTMEQAVALALMLGPAIEQAERLLAIDERHSPEVLTIKQSLLAAHQAATSLIHTAEAIYDVDILRDGDH